MGGTQSKQESSENNNNISQGNVEEQNLFFVQQLSKVSLKSKKIVSYYWIDPKVYNAQNQKYLNQFSAHFKIQAFTSLQGLKSQLQQMQNDQLIKVFTAASLPDEEYRYLENDKKINQLFLFCGNQQRAKLLCKNFPKIKDYALKSPQMIEILKKYQKQDKLDMPPTTLLTMLEQDRKILNKYRLNYYCITNNIAKNNAKQDFINLAKTLLPEQKQNIQKFSSQYNINLTNQAAYSQAISWAFQDNFYWKLIQKLPQATTDPKKLAYLRLPFSQLYQATFEKKVRKIPQQLYIVVQLNNFQISKIVEAQTLQNFIIFTSFMKGYTKKADAIKQFKQSDKNFMFQINFTQRPRYQKLDFGFVISENKNIKKNVLFNIYNFFRLESLTEQKRTGTLIYGPLAQAFHNRADVASKKRLSQYELMLLRNYDYLQQTIKKDNSQAAILQMNGYFKQSLKIYQRKLEYLRKTKASQQQICKYTLLTGDAYRLNQDYDEAEKQYKSITNQDYKLVVLVHLLELYLKKGDDKNSQIILQQLEQTFTMRKLKQKFPDQAYKAENFIGLQWMKQGRFKQALKKYKNLQNQASLYYQHRFQAIPLVYDLFRNMATCQAKLNNHKQALNLLNSTKQWQVVCQGDSASLALTETMIQGVYQNLGNFQQAKIAAQNLSNIKQHVNISQNKYLNQSLVAISMGLAKPKNINQSIVNVNMQPQSNNVNQSIVNVNTQPQKININQSIVNINSDIQPPRPIQVNNSSINIQL